MTGVAALSDHVILIHGSRGTTGIRLVLITPFIVFITFMLFAFMAASTNGCSGGPAFLTSLTSVSFTQEDVHLWGARYLPRDFDNGWRWITSALVHASFSHLAVNAVFLMVCGIAYERTAGPFFTLLLAILVTLGGGVFAAAFESPCLTFLGMSGICFGFAAAVIIQGIQMAVTNEQLPGFFARIPGITWWSIVGGETFMLFGAFIEPVILRSQDVSYMTHFGGFLTGQAIAILFCTWPKKWRYIAYTVALVEVLLVFLLAPVLVFTKVIEEARVCL